MKRTRSGSYEADSTSKKKSRRRSSSSSSRRRSTEKSKLFQGSQILGHRKREDKRDEKKTKRERSPSATKSPVRDDSSHVLTRRMS